MTPRRLRRFQELRTPDTIATRNDTHMVEFGVTDGSALADYFLIPEREGDTHRTYPSGHVRREEARLRLINCSREKVVEVCRRLPNDYIDTHMFVQIGSFGEPVSSRDILVTYFLGCKYTWKRQRDRDEGEGNGQALGAQHTSTYSCGQEELAFLQPISCGSSLRHRKSATEAQRNCGSDDFSGAHFSDHAIW
ncbi:rNA polymerase sigma factor [Anopheles sinensis]|uniref:RNA polymerase sigma factor n=1 Tax=Anopheles sinensis TaxID=74873 RepID=A0A084VUT2_ANOSI|nr:rNA polymerase sigma factor [Anopheles sinensis]